MALNQLFIKDASIPNIGRKYISMNNNVFKNEFVREIVARYPQFHEYMQVNATGYEQKSDTLVVNKEALKRQRFDNLDDIFKRQIDLSTFYKHVKNRRLFDEDGEDPEKVANAAFIEACLNLHKQGVISPDMIPIYNKIYYLYDQAISLDQAQAIHKYLKCIAYFPAK